MGAAVSHPYLLFHDISETPGYKYSTVQPWKTYQQQIISSANAALTRDFSKEFTTYNRVFYRADWARDAGLAYQITKKPEYAEKAKEALLNLDVGTVSMKTDNALALGSYALAYDFVQPTLDAQSDSVIRDKLATLADTVYKDLNDNGRSRNYISFSDYHGQAYPMVGIAGAALSDFTNPHNLPLSSGPADWYTAGTDYLFVNDKLHTSGKSVFSFGFDEGSGKSIYGAYKTYVMDDFAWWLQVYNHVYNTNPFEEYPATKLAFTSELWESMPNWYGNDFETSGNVKWTYNRYFVNLLSDDEKPLVMNYLDEVEKADILPYSSVTGGKILAGLLYCVYDNYDNIPREYPYETSHLDRNGVFQVFRGNWQTDSDWLSLVTWNFVTPSNRVMFHGDQAGIEYYSHGDLLLADAGENKYVLDRLYGDYEIHHNSIAVSDPRSPYPLSSWAGSRARGIFKGDANALETPLPVTSAFTTTWIDFIDTQTTIRKITGDSYGLTRDLNSPISYTRSVLYPEKDYFILIDRMESDDTWKYSIIMRPTSLVIKPTTMVKNKAVGETDVGHVEGTLVLDNSPFDWEALQFRKETDTGITNPNIVWQTTNPYGKDVELSIFSVPAPKIYVNKLVGRIAGYDARSEVFSPVLRLESPEDTSLYRITLLLPKYAGEEQRSVIQIPVYGKGTAVRVDSSRGEDIIYAGTGISSFDQFRTDACVAHIRTHDGVTELTLFGGTFLDYGEEQWIRLQQAADYITVKRNSDNTIEYFTGNEPGISVTLFNSDSSTPGRRETIDRIL